jgi:hypothetical protein
MTIVVNIGRMIIMRICTSCNGHNFGSPERCQHCGDLLGSGRRVNRNSYCIICGSQDVFIQTVSEYKRWNPFLLMLYIILVFVPIIGWIVLFAVLVGRKSYETLTYSTCQSCGRRWEVH